MSRRFTPLWFAKRLGLALASVTILVLLLEGGFRLLGFEPIYEVYSKPSILWQHDERLGWSHQPGASQIYRGPRPYPIEFEVPIRINALGLRGPELQELPEDGYRVLLLGDSSVAAFEVPFEETFGAVTAVELTRRLERPVQVINAGVRGYGTDQALLYYREGGRALRPDLVVHVHANNDLYDNATLHRMRRPFGKAAFALRPDGQLEPVGLPIPRYPICSHRALGPDFEPRDLDTALTRAFCQLQVGLFDQSALFTFVSLRVAQSRRLTRLLYELGSPDPTAWVPSRSQAARLAGLGLGATPGAKPGTAPQRFEKSSRKGLPYQYELTTALLLELAREVRSDGTGFLLYIATDELSRIDASALEREGVETIQPLMLHTSLDPRRYRFRNDSHFNALGHQRFARPLIDRIERLVDERTP